MVLRVPTSPGRDGHLLEALSGDKASEILEKSRNRCKATPPDVGAGANSSPPEFPRKAASSQLVPWSRKDSPCQPPSTLS